MATSTLSSAPVVTTSFPLEEEKKPKYWFWKTVYDPSTSHPRLNLLPNQFVPCDESGESYLHGIDTWNTACDRKIREHFGAGTIFVSDKIKIYTKSYHVADGHLFPLVNNSAIYTVASEDMREHYQNFLNPVALKPKAVTPSTPITPKAGSLMEIIKNDTRLAPPTAESGFYVEPDMWYLLLRNIIVKENTLIFGPTGTGKTQLFALAAQKLGLAFSTFDMGSMHDPISSLLGANRLKKKKSFFDPSRFSQVIQEPGMVLLDELSRGDAKGNNILFPTTDDRRELPMEMAGTAEKRNIKVHPECVFVATANLGFEYTGTQSIDRAIKDRFFLMELDYMPKETEAKVLVSRCGISLEQGMKIATVAEKMRAKASNGDLSTAISHRHTIKTGKLITDGFELRHALEMVSMPLVEKGEREIIKTILASL